MNVLFVNSTEPACGVHQFGLNLFRVLSQSERFEAHYCAPASDDELAAHLQTSNPGCVLFNFYPCTMPWVSLRTLDLVRAAGLRAVSIFHEVRITGFDLLAYPDPTFMERSQHLTDWVRLGRFLPPPLPERKQWDGAGIPVISTSGFGFGWKGHERVVRQTALEFKEAVVRVHLPFARHGDADGAGAREVAQKCREAAAVNRGIDLRIDHDFMGPVEFVEWLGESDLNAYLYDDTNFGRGIASTTDHALAARRPIALTRSWMFRHLFDVPGIFTDTETLRSIMLRGIEPLRPAYWRFGDKAALEGLERVVDKGMNFTNRLLNRLLTDEDRVAALPTIAEMNTACPDIMGRKIAEANVQQAWILSQVRRIRACNILCVGCFEDTAYATLLHEGAPVEGIDPGVHGSRFTVDGSRNVSLAEFCTPERASTFACVFATSVIEHVPDDSAFIRQICTLLEPDGVGLLTADYRADYQPGDPLPATDVRFYTPADVARLGGILREQGCYWVDRPCLDGEPDFTYQGHRYSFLALAFKKL